MADMETQERKTYAQNQVWYLGLAMQQLAKAVSSPRHDAGDIDSAVEQTYRYLNEFLGEVKPCPTLTEEEANLSVAMHTYMRKYWDEPLSVLLYSAVKEGKAPAVWAAFVQTCWKHWDKPRDMYHHALVEAERVYDETSIPDNQTMFYLLKMWPEKDFNLMIKMFKTDGWV